MTAILSPEDKAAMWEMVYKRIPEEEFEKLPGDEKDKFVRAALTNIWAARGEEHSPTQRVLYPAHYPLLIPSNDTRKFGIHIVAGRGSGKSRYLGRYLAFHDYLSEVPTVILDTGITIDNFLHQHILYLRWLKQSDPAYYNVHAARLTRRIRYVNMAGEGGFVVPFPLYYRFGNEDAFTVSQRFVEVIKRLDPELTSAAVQGYNPLWTMATHAGKILTTLGFQVTEMMNLLRYPEQWKHRFQQALSLDPEMADSVAFFTEEYPKWQTAWKASLFRKLTLFTADKNMRALFGASKPGIDWNEVVEKRQIVLLDFRDIFDKYSEEISQFLSLWTFTYLRDFIRFQGSGRQGAISVIIDELATMTNKDASSGMNLFAKDLGEFVNRLMRAYNVWGTFAHQQMEAQFSDTIQKLLIGMGTHMFGRIGTMDDALGLAKNFFPVDPLKVKRLVGRTQPWLFGNKESGYRTYSFHGIQQLTTYTEPVEFTIPEQHYENAYLIQRTPPFYFFTRLEGQSEIQSIDFSDLEQGIYPSENVARNLKLGQMEEGQSVNSVLGEIAARLNPLHPIQQVASTDLPFRRKGEL
jgi:hypothetical protein